MISPRKHSKNGKSTNPQLAPEPPADGGRMIVLTAPLTEAIDHAGYFIQMAMASLPIWMEGVINRKYPKWREVEHNPDGSARYMPEKLELAQPRASPKARSRRDRAAAAAVSREGRHRHGGRPTAAADRALLRMFADADRDGRRRRVFYHAPSTNTRSCASQLNDVSHGALTDCTRSSRRWTGRARRLAQRSRPRRRATA